MNYENFCTILDRIEKCPDTWRQDTWFCDTQACFAGHAYMIATMSNYEKAYDAFMYRQDDFWKAVNDFIGMPDDASQAEWLYDATRTLGDFRTVRETGRVPLYDADDMV